MCEGNKKCGPCSLKENFEIEGKDFKSYKDKMFKWKEGKFTYVVKKVEFSPITHTPSSDVKSYEAKGYENTVFKFVGNDVIKTRKWQTQPPSSLPVMKIQVVSGPDPNGKGEYSIGFKGMNKFSIIEIITENKSFYDKILLEAKSIQESEGVATCDFAIVVRSKNSSLNNERGSEVLSVKKGDKIEYSCQSGSLGELWTVYNKTRGGSGSLWKYDYKNPEFVSNLTQITEAVLNEDSATANLAAEKKQYANVKDLDVVRPRMAPKPDTGGLPSKSYAAKECKLYLQDEASYIIIDKYGFEKGYKAWEDSIGRGGSMYAIAADIANQKWVMCKDLGLTKNLIADYYFASYYAIWKKWAAKKTPKPIATSLTARKDFAKAPNVANPAPKTSKVDQMKKVIQPSSKDIMRIDDLIDQPNALTLANKMANATSDINKLIGRGKEAETRGRKDIANLFYSRAKTMLGEAKALKENAQDAQITLPYLITMNDSLEDLKSLKSKDEWSADALDAMNNIKANLIKLRSYLANNTEMRNN
jgi:hypothetical protein